METRKHIIHIQRYHSPCGEILLGSNGSLAGFAGGLDAKRRLLAIENGDMPLEL